MKLPASVALILAAVAGGLEIIQQYVIPMSTPAHTIVAFSLVVFLGMGIVPLSNEKLAKLVPLHVAAALTIAAGVLQAIQQLSFGVSPAVHSVLSIALLVLAALHIRPVQAQVRS